MIKAKFTPMGSIILRRFDDTASVNVFPTRKGRQATARFVDATQGYTMGFDSRATALQAAMEFLA